MNLDLSVSGDSHLFALSKKGAYYEPETTHFLLKVLRPGMIFIDVGANSGYFTLLAGMRVGPTGHVFSFEPTPGAFRRLVENVRLNRLTNVSLSSAAVGAMPGTSKIRESLITDGMNSLASLPQQGSFFDVSIVTLDDSVLESGEMVIKIDVEGVESDVLAGAVGLLRSSFDVQVVFEYKRLMSHLRGENPNVTIEFLRKEGFRTYSMLPDGSKGWEIGCYRDVGQVSANLLALRVSK